jgi:histidinol-phosphate aminotransferase
LESPKICKETQAIACFYGIISYFFRIVHLKFTPMQHGGADREGVPRHDFSTSANASGPCPEVLAAVQAADVTHYPDPNYTDVRERLAAHHTVAPERILIMGSASEAIARLSVATRRLGLQRVWYPAQHYADVERLGQAVGLQPVAQADTAQVLWCCEPTTPTGHNQPDIAALVAEHAHTQVVVLDCAYAPLRLSGAPSLSDAARDAVWQLWSPNKALGMTGIRAAYVIAPLSALSDPQGLAARLGTLLQWLAPSWPVGTQGVAMLHAWCLPSVQRWLVNSRQSLLRWKQQQLQLCERLGWAVQPSDTNYHLAQPLPTDGPGLSTWRSVHGVKLRDAHSFGMPGWVRMGVLSPGSQQALWRAVHHWRENGHTPLPSDACVPGPSP